MEREKEVIDKETQDILDEIKAEGLPIENDEEPEEVKEPVAPLEPKEPVLSEPELPKEPIEPKEPTAKTDAVERPVHFMPLSKFNDYKSKWEVEKQAEITRVKQETAAEYETKIQQLSGKPTSLTLDDEIAKFAEEKNLDEDLLKGIVDIVRKTNTIDPNISSVISGLVKEKEYNETVAQYETMFSQEMASLQKDFPDEPISSLKDKLHELAFSEGSNTKSLFEIYFRNVKPATEKKKTFEPSKGGVQRTQSLDIDKIKDDPEAINNLSDEDFDAFSEKLGSERTSRIRRKTY